MRIILASESKFRQKALEILGLDYEVVPSKIDEKSIMDSNPFDLAKKLAEAKAEEIGEKNDYSLTIAGDLFVVFDDKIYEKPKDLDEAFQMIKTFSGNKIKIIAGVAVYNSKIKKLSSAVGEYDVKFRELEDYEIKDYISRYPVLKLSAAFEGDALIRFAEHVEGQYPFLTAFPMKELILMLRENGIRV